MKEIEKKSPGRGRPREFDPDTALDAAMRLFWVRGYEATSMSDIVEALGMNRASLYAAFGDKEALFLKVLERYRDNFSARPFAALSEFDDPYDKVWNFLERTAEHLTDTRLPRGCLFANAILETPDGSATIGRMVANSISKLETTLYDVLRRAAASGQIDPDADVRALARFYTATVQGMALIGKVTPDPTAVIDIARSAMRAWPRRVAESV